MSFSLGLLLLQGNDKEMVRFLQPRSTASYKAMTRRWLDDLQPRSTASTRQ